MHITLIYKYRLRVSTAAFTFDIPIFDSVYNNCL